MPRPKYHFLTIMNRTDGKKSIVALPHQTFGRKPVPERVLVKDAGKATVVTRARTNGSPGDVFFTTTLAEANGCLKAKDIHKLDESEKDIIFSDARDCFEKYLHSLSN